MKPMFTMDKKDIRKLERFFEHSPKDFQKATANVLTSLAFKTRKNDIVNLHRGMIIRDEKFLARNLKVKTAKNTKIENQVALAYSLERPRFTGWKEQQYGTPSPRRRAGTKSARGGNMRSKMRGKARLKSNNKIYKPSQFEGRSSKGKFQLMLRVLSSRGGGRFILDKPYGKMEKGLYEITRGKKISKLQAFRPSAIKTKRFKWRTMSLNQLQSGNDIKKIWQTSINFITKKYK